MRCEQLRDIIFLSQFACFERTLEALYKYVVPKPREQCTKGEQLTVTFTAGYIAGVFCAIVSHPADTIVSKLNKEKGSTAMDIAKRLGWKGECWLASFENSVYLVNFALRVETSGQFYSSAHFVTIVNQSLFPTVLFLFPFGWSEKHVIIGCYCCQNGL